MAEIDLARISEGEIMNEAEALRAEIAELRAEVESLRQQQASHYCVSLPAQWPQPFVAPGAAGGLPPVVVYPGTAKPMTFIPAWHNTCGAAAGVPPALVYNTVAGNY